MTNASALPIDLTDAQLRRFWSKVALPDENGCMLWLAGLRRGYGQFAATHSRNLLANRISCTLAHGPAPSPEHESAHSCRNRSCVAPAHLRWATAADNMSDRVRDDTLARGERQWKAKLTDATALEILAIDDDRTMEQIARDYGVTKTTVGLLLRGITWKHLPRPHRDGPREPKLRRKLTEEAVREIIRRQDVSQSKLAQEFGVSQAHISDIRLGLAWKHIPREEAS